MKYVFTFLLMIGCGAKTLLPAEGNAAPVLARELAYELDSAWRDHGITPKAECVDDMLDTEIFCHTDRELFFAEYNPEEGEVPCHVGDTNPECTRWILAYVKNTQPRRMHLWATYCSNRVTITHELTHVLSWCMFSAHDHVNPEFIWDRCDEVAGRDCRAG